MHLLFFFHIMCSCQMHVVVSVGNAGERRHAVTYMNLYCVDVCMYSMYSMYLWELVWPWWTIELNCPLGQIKLFELN